MQVTPPHTLGVWGEPTQPPKHQPGPQNTHLGLLVGTSVTPHHHASHPLVPQAPSPATALCWDHSHPQPPPKMARRGYPPRENGQKDTGWHALSRREQHCGRVLGHPTASCPSPCASPRGKEMGGDSARHNRPPPCPEPQLPPLTPGESITWTVMERSLSTHLLSGSASASLARRKAVTAIPSCSAFFRSSSISCYQDTCMSRNKPPSPWILGR